MQMPNPSKSTLPGLRDLFITCIEFVSCLAIVASFFRSRETYVYDTKDHDSNGNNGSDGVNEALVGALFFNTSPFLFGSAFILVALPRCCARGDCSVTFLRHPHFAAAVQLGKIVICSVTVYFLLSHKMMMLMEATSDEQKTDSAAVITSAELKVGQDLISSGILAGCELLSALHTIVMSCCSSPTASSSKISRDERSWNPSPRWRWLWITLNILKDFGIITTLVKLNELKVILLEFPSSVFLGGLLAYRDINSQHARYHIFRLLMVGVATATLYGGSFIDDTKFELFENLTIAIVLVVCEVLLAVLEVVGPSPLPLQDDSYQHAANLDFATAAYYALQLWCRGHRLEGFATTDFSLLALFLRVLSSRRGVQDQEALAGILVWRGRRQHDGVRDHRSLNHRGHERKAEREHNGLEHLVRISGCLELGLARV
ncbi:hypothetical protein FI667_g13789, partial [Globisporangium splendens]